MSRAKKWIALTGLGAALAAGPGCMMMDEFEDACGCHTAEYRREPSRGTQPAIPQDPAATAANASGAGVTNTATANTGTVNTGATAVGKQPGIYPDAGQK